MVKFKYMTLVILLGLLTTVGGVGSIFGQSATGQITGSIEDSNGARVPGATVSVTNLSTSLQRQATSNESGDFALLLLPPGNYKVEVTAQGFKTVLIETVAVNITQTSTL